MLCKVIEEDNKSDFERAVSKFLEEGNAIQSISYSTVSHGYHIYHSALIVYSKN